MEQRQSLQTSSDVIEKQLADLKIQYESQHSELNEHLEAVRVLEEEKQELQEQLETALREKEQATLALQEVQQQPPLEETDETSAATPSQVPPPTTLASNVSSIYLQPAKPDRATHEFVVEKEWNGKDYSGYYTGWILKETTQPDTKGTLRMFNGDAYDGGWKNGKLHGPGVLITIDGHLFNGNWQDGLQHGWGVNCWDDGRL